MDTLLVGGDHYLDGRGLPVAVGGDEALVQRALIRLSVRRGADARAPELGSMLYKLRGAAGEVLDRLALSYAQEALAPVGEIAVESAAVTRWPEEEGEGMTVAVRVRLRGQAVTLEVAV